jgi:hypothetical protein
MTTDVQHYKEAVQQRLDALQSHDAETQRLLDGPRPDDLDFWRKRESDRRTLSARLEGAVAGLLGVLP